jgi:hypothetical protein
MQPANAEGGESGSSSLKKWGPIGAIAAVVVLIVGLIVVSSGGDDSEDSAPAATDSQPVDTEPADSTPTDSVPNSEPDDTEPDNTEPDSTEPPNTEPPSGGDITYPLSIADAEDQGIEVAWDDRCDTELGTVAIKWFFAAPCYAPFEGDNGGATAVGVTGETIKVVLYQGPDSDPIIAYLTDAISVDDTNAQEAETLQNMFDLFNEYYETYGRKVELVVYESTGIATDEVTARADAVRIAEDFEPFAVIGGPVLTNAFADELAARDILCISCTPGQEPNWYEERDPYVWGLAIGAEQARQQATEFITKQLAGKNAEYAGDPDFQAQPRKYGHVYLESSASSTAIAEEFVNNLEADGVEISELLPYALDPASIQASAAQIIGKLKASGITSIVFAGDGIAPRDFTKEATAQEYFPEWIFVAPALVDLTAFARTYDQQQWAHAFGVSANLAAPVTPEITGYYALYEWYRGVEPPAPDTIGIFMPAPSLFFAILQQVGPELTHQAWRDAAFNAAATPSAISQPSLSWGDKGIWPDFDYNGVDDSTLMWWDPEATGQDEIRKEGVGMYQFVDGGARYLPGEWPTESKLFDPDGAVDIYAVQPPGEAPPDYPSPAD